MFDTEKQKPQLNLLISNLDNNFVEDRVFWRNLITRINSVLKVHNPDVTEFTYDEFCILFKEELQKYSEINDNLNIPAINLTVKQLIFKKINQR